MNLSNNYKYLKYVDCVHAHMDKDGNNCCDSKEDKEFEYDFT